MLSFDPTISFPRFVPGTDLLPTLQPSIIPEPIPINNPVVVAVAVALMGDFSAMRKPWHTFDHSRTRDTMMQCISHLIQQRRPNASYDWLEKLPEVAKRVEERLYCQARSFEEYNDPHTLIDRLNNLVQLIIDEENQRISQELLENELDQGGEGETLDEEEDEEVYEEEDSDTPRATTSKLSKTKTPKRLSTSSSTSVSRNISRQVSSQGCSRVFIVKVLLRVSEFVKGKSLPSIFTFKKELVTKWLEEAKEDCHSVTYSSEEMYYGGPPFIHDDSSTHWSEPHQLYTWWKNNVERRSKFKILQEDAAYSGSDQRRIARARWCEMVVALSEVIRSSSGSAVANRGLMEDKDDIQVSSGRSRGEHARARKAPQQYSEDSDSSYYSDFQERVGGYNRGVVTNEAVTFPVKLFDVISSGDSPLEWLDDGKGFSIVDPEEFIDHTLSRQFKHKTFAIFQRRLTSYGFKRIKDNGNDTYSYRHPQFQRDERAFVLLMKRVCRRSNSDIITSGRSKRYSSEKSGGGRIKIVRSRFTGSSGNGVAKRYDDEETSEATCTEEDIDIHDTDQHSSSLLALRDYTGQGQGSKRKRFSHGAVDVEMEDDDVEDDEDVDDDDVEEEEVDDLVNHDLVRLKKKYKTSSKLQTSEGRKSGGGGTSTSASSHSHNRRRKTDTDDSKEAVDDPTSNISSVTTSLWDPLEGIDTIDMSVCRPKRIFIDMTISNHGIFNRGMISRVMKSEEDGQRRSRVGETYQAQLPNNILLSSSSAMVTPSPNDYECELIWKGTQMNESNVNNAIDSENTSSLPMIGSLVLVDLKEMDGESTVTTSRDSSVGSNHLSSYRLACVLSHLPNEEESLQTSSNKMIVYDGLQELSVPLRHVVEVAWDYDDPAHKELSTTGSFTTTTTTAADRKVTSNSRDLVWTYAEVQTFCDGIRRHQDELQRIYPYLQKTRSYKQVVDFYNRIYSHGRCGGARRLLRIFRRIASLKNKTPVAVDDFDCENNGEAAEPDTDGGLISGQTELDDVSGQSFNKTEESKGPYSKLRYNIILGISKEAAASRRKNSTTSEAGGVAAGLDALAAAAAAADEVDKDETAPETSSPVKKRRRSQPTRRGGEVSESEHDSSVTGSKKSKGNSKVSKGKGKGEQDVAEEEKVVGEVFCVCQREEEGQYIACSNKASNCFCNGWVHAKCVGLVSLSATALRAMESYLCPPCRQKESESTNVSRKPDTLSTSTSSISQIKTNKNKICVIDNIDEDNQGEELIVMKDEQPTVQKDVNIGVATRRSSRRR